MHLTLHEVSVKLRAGAVVSSENPTARSSPTWPLTGDISSLPYGLSTWRQESERRCPRHKPMGLLVTFDVFRSLEENHYVQSSPREGVT